MEPQPDHRATEVWRFNLRAFLVTERSYPLVLMRALTRCRRHQFRQDPDDDVLNGFGAFHRNQLCHHAMGKCSKSRSVASHLDTGAALGAPWLGRCISCSDDPYRRLSGLASGCWPITLTVALAVFFAAHGVVRILTSFEHRRLFARSWRWLAISGSADLILARSSFRAGQGV